MSLPLELGQVDDPEARRALEQISLRWCQCAGLLPAGGTAGQILARDADGNAVWIDPSGAFAFFNA